MTSSLDISAPLSMVNTIKNSIKMRQVAFLAANGVNGISLNNMKEQLQKAGAVVKIIAPKLGAIKTDSRNTVYADQSFLTATSVCFDAVFIPGGEKSIAILINESRAIHFIMEAYQHCKAIGCENEGIKLLQGICSTKNNTETRIHNPSKGIVANGNVKEFIKAIAQHRFWNYEKERMIPA